MSLTSFFSSAVSSGQKPSQSSELLSNIIQDVKLVEALFKEDRLIEACTLLNSITQYIESEDVDPTVVESVQQKLNNSKNISHCKEFAEELSSLEKLIVEDDQWNVWNENIGMNGDVKVCVNKFEEKGKYFLKTEGSIKNSDLQSVCAALLEHELYSTWLPLCNKLELEAIVSPYRRIVDASFDFTLFKKECRLNVFTDILSDGGLLLYFKSLPLSSHSDQNSSIPNNHTQNQSRSQSIDIYGAFVLYEEKISYRDQLTSQSEGFEIAYSTSKSHSIDMINLANGLGADVGTHVYVKAIFKADLKTPLIPDW
eukprot:gene15569-21022_t